ncbi:TBC domain-containing kinase [Brachionus plicatilis]|uniref:TBC domain-containing kinase n=1 Tax=Brachionus plicatilis TaxID=10195 RepID=A0A3M7QA55_BRAPC|nr:TBC domain-containing kinase [Brachionus plicatilis]
MEVQFDLFEHLIKSPSKEFLNQIIYEAFNQSQEIKPSANFIDQLSQSLEIDQATSEKLIADLARLIRKLIFESQTNLQQIQDVLALSSLQTNLKNLLGKLLAERLPQFRNKLLKEEEMMPKLLDFKCRVDIKMEANITDSETKSGQQICLLNLKTDEDTKERIRANSVKQPIMDISDIIKQQFKKRSEKQLGLLSFLARLYPNDKCGSNGLPLTPNSIRIYGKFQYLKTITGPNLCQYVDIQRGQNERLFVLSEHYSLNLQDLLSDTYIYNLIITNSGLLLKWIDQILKAFLYLSDNLITNRLVSLKNICISAQGDVKLANYGLYYMSENGNCVDFAVFNLETLAPECYILDFLNTTENSHRSCSNSELLNTELANPKSDVWAIGCILVQFFFGLKNLSLKAEEVIEKMIEVNDFSSGYDFILDLYGIDQAKKNLVEHKTSSIYLKLIKKCLTIDSAERPNFRELTNFFDKCLSEEKIGAFCENKCAGKKKLNLFRNGVKFCESLDDGEEDILWQLGVNEVYFLWKLAAGDCLQTLKTNGRLKTTLSSIHKFSVYTQAENGFEHGKLIHEEESKFNDQIVPVSLDQLRKRFELLSKKIFFPLLEFKADKFEVENIQLQPVNIRELDIDYQLYRIVLFSRYLGAFPFKKEELIKECRIDIPPLYRNLAWAVLLEVPLNIEDIYSSINKEQVTSTDRQIDVDIPRCHQYDPLMATPQSHIKLKRVLKSWVLSNTNLVYWQGLDSLCAPFLYLNFNREELACGCLTNFVKKYAANFFLKDNSAVIHEYLAVFSHLISFNEPELAAHFESIDFKPDLYAIPWFLTMFAHIFPLYKIFHLWDCLLVGSSAFPLCIGVSILKQLRNILLKSDFNECILFFSELPEINIEKCVKDAVNIFQSTPESCTFREHSGSATEENDPLLDMAPISLDKLKSEMAPRISARDVISLAKEKTHKYILIDVRPNSLFSIGYVTESKNFPFESINFSKLAQALNPSSSTSDTDLALPFFLAQNKNAIKIIIASQEFLDSAIDLANKLVKLKFSKICVLHQGIESLKPTDIYIQEPKCCVNDEPKIENLNLELSKQTLNTMISGLNKIKDQLNSIAASQ